MEHRFHPRAAVQTEAVVLRMGTPVAICLTRDLSLGGTFIRTGAIDFYRNTPLELDLALKTKEGVERYRVSAFVVRNGTDGVGLMFLNTDAHTRAAIRSAQQQSAHPAGDPPRSRIGDIPNPPLVNDD